MKPSEKISKEEIIDSLKRSGYLLEGRIEKALKRAGYYVQTNSVYPDPLTRKLRELDIQAITANCVNEKQTEYFFTVLFIECVNNSQPFVFFTKKSDIHSLNHHHLKMAGFPLGFFNKEKKTWKCIHDELRMEKFLHYCKPKQATQFCSFVQKGDKKWIALHENEHFDCFRKLVDFLDFDVDKYFKSYTWAKKERLNLEAYYPILVVQGDLFEAIEKSSGIKLIPSNHVQFCMPQIIRGEEVNVFIDVVNEKYFQKYLGILRKESSKITKRLSKKEKEIRGSLEKIVLKTKGKKNHREIISAKNFGCFEKF